MIQIRNIAATTDMEMSAITEQSVVATIVVNQEYAVSTVSVIQ